MTWNFNEELARHGPHTTRPMSLSLARAYCAYVTRNHYENFSVVSVLLPRRLHRHFHAIYAYCRWADDLADETGGGPRALELLRWWRKELLRCYEGQATHPVMIALFPTIKQFHIPPRPFLDLLFAFEQDQLVKRYRTFEQLVEYCRHSANPVGRLVLYLCESFNAERAELSDHVCTALQLTNFWQDVSRDLDMGRVYLPEVDMDHFGYSREDLLARRFNREFTDLVAYEVDRTREMFERGFPLVSLMPSEFRVDIELFIRGGQGILRKIEQQSYDVWRQRPALSKPEKAMLLGGAIWRRLRSAIL